MGGRDMTDPDGIDQYWDIVATGSGRSNYPVDPVIVRQIDGLHARQRQTGADPAFLQQLRHELTAAPRTAAAIAPPDAAPDHVPMDGRSSALDRPRHGRSRPIVLPWSRPARVAIVLLLVALVATGASAYRQERQGVRLAAVVSGPPTTDLYMTVFDDLEAADSRSIPLDPITLADRPGGTPIDAGTSPFPRILSADGSTLVELGNERTAQNPDPRQVTITVRDGLTGVRRSQYVLPLPLNGSAVRLSQDGSRLVIGYTPTGDGSSYPPGPLAWQVAESSTGRMLATVPPDPDGRWATENWIDPDATRLYSLFLPFSQTNSGPGPARIVAHDLGSGAAVGQLVLPEVRGGTWTTDRTVTPNESTGEIPVMASLTPGVALSPDGATIALAHADEDVITLVDARHLRVERSITFGRSQTLRDRLLGFLPLLPQSAAAKMLPEGTTVKAVFGADGRHLYLLGQTTTYGDDEVPAVEPLGLRVVDLGDGTAVAAGGAEWLGVFPSTDGTSLYALRYRAGSSGPMMVQRLDAKTLAVEVERQVPGMGYPQLFLRPSVPDGADAFQ